MKAVETMEAMQSMVLQLRTGLKKVAKGGAIITHTHAQTHIYLFKYMRCSWKTIHANPHMTDEI